MIELRHVFDMFFCRPFDKFYIFQERFFPFFSLYSNVRDLSHLENISPLSSLLPTQVLKVLFFICESPRVIPLPLQPKTPRVTYLCQFLENFLIILIYLYLTLPLLALLLTRPIRTSR